MSVKSNFNEASGLGAALDGEGRTPLHMCALKGDRENAEKFLKLKINPNPEDINGRTPLYAAMASRDIAMVELLVKNGARFDVIDNAGNTPLVWAIDQNAPVEFLEKLRVLGCPLDGENKSGRTALHFVAAVDMPAVADYLIGAGVPVDRADNEGKTALHAAVEGKSPDTLRLLLERGADPLRRTLKIETPLYLAAAAGDGLNLSILLEQPSVARTTDDFRFHENGFTPLMAAAAGNHLEVAEKLLSIGADPNKRDLKNRHSLFIAAESGHPEMARLLIRHGADVAKAPALESNKETMTHRVALANYKETLQVLHAAGMDLNAADSIERTALHDACSNGNLEKVRALLDLGADMNAIDTYGNRPIDISVGYLFYSDSHAIIKRLLENGARQDLSPFPNAASSPLHASVRGGHDYLVDLFLKYNANVHEAERNSDALTPLMIAAQYERTDMFRTLLQKGADPLRKDGEGRTLLHLLPENVGRDFMKMVFDLPGVLAEINTPDKQGVTALHKACGNGGISYAHELLHRGADSRLYDEKGLTPVHLSAARNEVLLLNLFEYIDGREKQEKSGNPLIWDIPTREEGDTPLHIAAKLGRDENVSLLIIKGAALDTPNKAGETPLMLALANKNEKAAQMLMLALAVQGKIPMSPAAHPSPEGPRP